MFGKILPRLLLLMTLAFVGLANAANDPSLHDVYQAAESGRLNEAQAMMDKVLRDHPNSGKAHFVEAELMVKQGRMAAAQGELATAERLAPGLPFAKPEAVQSLKARLSNRVQAPVAQYVQPAQTPASSGFPWGMLLIGGALVAAVIFFVRSLSNRNNVTVVPAGYGAGGGTYGGGGFGPGPVMQPGGGGMAAPMGGMGGVGGGMGSGILGGLATGAAVGAGMVAGEALMHRVLDGGHHDNAVPNSAPVYVDRPDTSSYDMGGNDFGVSDGGSWDDSGSSGGGDDWS
ncbi:MAG TPA: tetratricopeptide repeat protein [Rhodocyclaceae bacterium]|nr:tetratricopeptide repeat protein [Rhodocyclaceae bacterium]